MRTAKKNQVSGYRESTTAFLGLNRQNTCAENEIHEGTNLSSHSYPYLAPRRPRGTSVSIGGGSTAVATSFVMYEKDDNGTNREYTLYATESGGKAIFHSTELGTTDYESSDADFPKTFTKMGSYIIVMPDRILFETLTGQWKELDISLTKTSGIGVAPCDIDGNQWDTDVNSSQYGWDTYFYDSTTQKTYTYDTVTQVLSECNHPYFLIRSTEDLGMEIGSTVKLTSPNGLVTDFGLHCGEFVTVLNTTVDTNGTADTDDDIYEYICEGYFSEDTHSLVEGTLTIDNDIPDLDYICVSGNRVWGCYYGNDLNEIYASALGSPYSWRKYDGVSTDSYTVSIGEEGKWTGAIEYEGRPYFFKEKMIYSVYGSYPAQFQLNKTNALGVKDGCKACVVDGTMFYGSLNGVCAYNGSYPSVISLPCGTITANEISGAGGRLYVSNNGDIYCYDLVRGLWHHEDRINTIGCLFLYAFKNDVYFAWRQADMDYRYALLVGNADETVSWMAETPIMRMYQSGYPYRQDDRKYISELQFTARFKEVGSFTVSVSYDEGDYEQVYTMSASGLTWRDHYDETWDELGTWAEVQELQGFKVATIHIRLKRSTAVQIKLQGSGQVEILQMTRNWRGGSDSLWR